jgi:hypothetical protein
MLLLLYSCPTATLSLSWGKRRQAVAAVGLLCSTCLAPSNVPVRARVLVASEQRAG